MTFWSPITVAAYHVAMRKTVWSQKESSMVDFQIAYTEPTTNTAGGPPELTSTTAVYTVDNGPEKSIVSPATSPDGGGLITKAITESIATDHAVTIRATAFATNASGHSVRAPGASLVIEPTPVPPEPTPEPPGIPGVPTNLIVVVRQSSCVLTWTAVEFAVLYRVYQPNGQLVTSTAATTVGIPYRKGRRQYYLLGVSATGQEGPPLWFETK